MLPMQHAEPSPEVHRNAELGGLMGILWDVMGVFRGFIRILSCLYGFYKDFMVFLRIL